MPSEFLSYLILLQYFTQIMTYGLQQKVFVIVSYTCSNTAPWFVKFSNKMIQAFEFRVSRGLGLKLQKHQTLKILDIFILLLLINKIQNTIVNTNIWITGTLFRGRILGVGREGFSTICISSPVFFFLSVMLWGGWWAGGVVLVMLWGGWWVGGVATSFYKRYFLNKHIALQLLIQIWKELVSTIASVWK